MQSGTDHPAEKPESAGYVDEYQAVIERPEVMRVADYIFSQVSKYVDTVFYLPGGGCATLVDALGQSGLKMVSCLHEQGAGFAAVGYAQHKGLGVCLVTSGPGVTNVMTPCLAAWVDSVPVMFISGNVMLKWRMFKGMRSRGTQEGPTIAMVTPITKEARQVVNAPIAVQMIDRMLRLTQAGRPGPCWLDVPQDVQGINV